MEPGAGGTPPNAMYNSGHPLIPNAAPPMADTSSLAIATNIVTSPSEAFAALKERPRFLLPLLLLIVGYSAVSFLYINKVDLGWLMEQQLQLGGADLSAADREVAIERATSLSPVFYGVIGAVGTSFYLLLVTFLVAAYYTGVSFVSGDGVRLKQWFSLILWCLFPSILGLIAQIVNLSINDARFMPQDAINPLSFGNLLSIDRTGKTILQRVLLGIDVTVIWTLVLSVLGYQAFAKSSIVKAAIVVLAPLAVIVVIGTLLALR
jgi:Yip1-like protein